MRVLTNNRQRKVRLSIPRLRRDGRKALGLLGLKEAELSLLVVGERRMRELNLKHRGVGAVTDVLSFPLWVSRRDFPAKGEFPLGDIVICAPRAQAQAKEAGHSLTREVRFLLAHGLVHLMGYDHEAGGYQRRRARELQEMLMKGF